MPHTPHATPAFVASPASAIASELRSARLRAGLTQTQLAGMAGVSLSKVGALEAGAIPQRSAVLERLRATLAEVEQRVDT